MAVASVMCYCGSGCKGRASSTDPRVMSERDAVAKFLSLYGAMPVYAEGAMAEDEPVPLFVVESVEDERLSAKVPTAREARKHADPFEGDPLRKARHGEAVAYIESYMLRVKSGDIFKPWDFILNLHSDQRWGSKWFKLSDRQVEVLLNSKARDAAWQAEREASRKAVEAGATLHNAEDIPGADPRAILPEGRTLAAVPNSSGELTFLIFDKPGPKDRWGNPSKWHGWVFVKQQVSDNETRLGAQKPGQKYSGQWNNLVQAVLDDVDAAVRRYGQNIGVCGRCGRKLTNAASRAEGIGPECAAKAA